MSNDFLRWLDQGRGITSSPSRGNLSYADPKFGKRKKSSDGGQFDWQGKLLKDLPKSMGSTYEAKFNTLASQIGVPKEQVNAFKTFIDAQEYGAKTHTQHVRDSDIKQAKRYGEGARIILREREQREKQAEAERLAKLAKQQGLQKTIKGWQGLPGMNVGVQGTGRSNRAMDSLTQPKKDAPKLFQDIKKALTGENHRIEPTKQSNLHFGDSDSRTTIRPPENVERFGGRVINSVTLGLPEEALKHRLKKNPNDEELQAEFERIYGGEMAWHDYVADILGYLPPGLAGVKAARAAGVGAKGLTKGISKHNLKEIAKEGAVIGGGIELGNVAFKEALNPDDQNWLDNLLQVGIGAGAGAVLDPALFMAGPLGRKIAENMAEGALSKTFKKQVEDAIRFNSHTTLNTQRPVLGGPDPKSGLTEGMSQGQVKFSSNSPIDDMLGRTPELEQPQVKSDPYGEGYFDDSDIDALIAKQQTASTLADEHFPTIERKPVNLDEYTPVSSKVTEKVKDAETGWQAFRRQFDSDVHGVKTIERELVKNDTKNILKINNIGSVVYEDSLEKGVRGLQKTVARAEKSAKNSYNPIIERISKAGISKKEFEQYTSAMHFRDIYANNMDKVVRRGEILEELEHLDSQFSESPPKKTLDKYTNKADAEKEWKQSLEKRERELVKEFESVEEYVLPEGATEEWANYTIAKWQNNPTMVQAQKDFIAEQQVDLRMREQAGTYSEAQIEAMIESHPNYISMRRDIPEDVSGVGSSRSVGRKDILKRKDGSELEILSPVNSAYRNRMMAVINSERTEVINRIGKMLEIEGAESYFRKVPEPNQNTLRGFENGQPVYYEVPPTLVNLYRNLDKTSEKSVLKAIQGLATLQKKMTTNLNVGFHLFSGVRDPIQALGNSRTQAHIGHTVLGYLDSFIGKNLEKMTGGAFKSYRDVYMNLGNERSTLIGMDNHSLQKMSKAIEEGKFADGSSVLNPIKAIEGFGMRVEHGPRLAEFRSAKRKGLSDTDAAFEAADIIDYSDMGSFVREANKYIPYLNPTLRGNIRTFQALKNNPKQFATVGLMNVTLPTVALYALRYADTTNDVQRDKINNLQPWQKNLLWAIPIPNSNELAFFPKPFIFGQIFASPVERTLDKVYGNTNKSSAELLKESGLDMLSVLSVPYEVAGLMSGFEVLANYDLFSQMPIEDRAMQNESDVSERHNVYTSELAKLIGKAGVSPAKVDHLLKNMAGTLGRDGLDVIDNLLSGVSEDIPAKVNPIEQILDPTKRFKHRDTQASGQYGEIMEQASKDDRKQREELEWLKSMGIKSTTKMETHAQQMYAANKELNDQIKEVRESKTLTSKEKQKQIARLRAEQRKIGTKFITE